MSFRLQRRDWLHLQRFAPCEVSTTCQRSFPLHTPRESLHLQPFATFRSKLHE